jgi:hypothetical protein
MAERRNAGMQVVLTHQAPTAPTWSCLRDTETDLLLASRYTDFGIYFSREVLPQVQSDKNVNGVQKAWLTILYWTIVDGVAREELVTKTYVARRLGVTITTIANNLDYLAQLNLISITRRKHPQYNTPLTRIAIIDEDAVELYRRKAREQPDD